MAVLANCMIRVPAVPVCSMKRFAVALFANVQLANLATSANETVTAAKSK